MPSIKYYLLRFYLKRLQKQRKATGDDLSQRRKTLESVARKFQLPPNTVVERVSANAVPAEWISFKGMKPKGVFFYLHGGAYNSGSLASHRHLVAALAHKCQCTALHIDYRLAPEHVFPAAIDDAVSAYVWLAKKVDLPIIIAGDSAGGGMAVATMLKLKEEKKQLPKLAVLMAPWVNLQGNSTSLASLGKKDVILTKEVLESSAMMYAGDKRLLTNPYVSPLFGDLTGLPTTLVQVGTHDLLLGDGEDIANKLMDHGVTTTLSVWPKMLHIWQFFVGKLPEADRAIDEIAAFIQKEVFD